MKRTTVGDARWSECGQIAALPRQLPCCAGKPSLRRTAAGPLNVIGCFASLSPTKGISAVASSTISYMKLASAFCISILLALSAVAQVSPKSATVPITLDHNRVIIDVYFPMPDGSKTRVRGWVDNGNDGVWLTESLARKLNLEFTGEMREAMGRKIRMVQPPPQFLVGDMAIQLKDIKEARGLLERDSIAPGTSAQINLPATVLRNYDVLVDYPNREFTIATRGTLRFKGTPTKGFVNPANGLIQVASTVEGEKRNLGLDLGATVTLIANASLTDWVKAHPQWPHMTGAVGPANLWGLDEEPNWTLLRIPKIEFGSTTLTNVLAASFPGENMDWFEKRAGTSSIGLIGADALLNYKVGLDYAHSTVYLDQTSKFNFPDMDVVGLVLRPEPDGHYTIIGVADYEGKPSVAEVQKGDVLLTVDGGRATGATMGQVWSLLSGSPGTVRTLVIQRGEKQMTVQAKVASFLSTGHTPGVNKIQKKPK
jgi:hypothetical protein